MQTAELLSPEQTADRSASRLCHLLISGILLLYLGCMLIFAFTAPLYSDDYLNTGTLCQLIYGTPFKDFQPWNSLLGHYIQIPALLLAPDPVFGPIAVRIELGILSFLILSLLSWRMMREFPAQVVLLGLLGLFSMEFFIWMSVAIRLDTLSAWAGFGALLLGLRSRWMWSGLFCGLSFLLSQKGLYQFACLNGALTVGLLLLPKRREGLRNLLRFNTPVLAIGLSYYLFISVLWGGGSVLQQHIGKLETLTTLYRMHGILELSLIYIFQNNYLFTALSLTGLLLLFTQGIRYLRHDYITREEIPLRYRITLCTYLFCLMIICGIHPHPYAYFWIILLPGLWLCLMHALSALLSAFSKRPLPQQSAFACISIALILIPVWMMIPNLYWTMSFFGWMCLIGPVVLCATCFPMFLLCRRFERTRPQAIRSIFVGALALLFLLCATTPRTIYRLFQPTWYNASMAERFLIPRLQQMQRHNKSFIK